MQELMIISEQNKTKIVQHQFSQSRKVQAFYRGAEHYFAHHPYRSIWLGISKQALLHNIQVLRQVSAGKKCCAVLKGDAYGHSISIVAPLIASYVDAIAITENSEAETVRNCLDGDFSRRDLLRLPLIRVRIADLREIKAAFIKGLEIEEPLGSLQHANGIAKLAQELRREKPVQVQISLDAAQMGRDGFSLHPDHLQTTLNEIRIIAQNPLLQITGIYTHFPSADQSSFDASIDALKRFVEQVKALKPVLPAGVDVHAFGSAATLRANEIPAELLETLTMNRFGAALYGHESYKGQNLSQLKNVLSAMTFVNDVFLRRQGDTVGYGSHYQVLDAFEYHAHIPGGWNVFNRMLLQGQHQPHSIAPFRILNQFGGQHDVLGNPSMNSVICKALSSQSTHLLQSQEPVFFLNEEQCINHLSRLLGTTPASISSQLGNPLYVARFLIDE